MDGRVITGTFWGDCPESPPSFPMGRDGVTWPRCSGSPQGDMARFGARLPWAPLYVSSSSSTSSWVFGRDSDMSTAFFLRVVWDYVTSIAGHNRVITGELVRVVPPTVLPPAPA